MRTAFFLVFMQQGVVILTDISRQPIIPIYKGQESLILESVILDP